jgi:glycosyltransferase involved in cell wall biosynthesis
MERLPAGVRVGVVDRGAPPPHPAATTLRVGMVASLFPPSIGGIQSHTLRLGQKLVERGVEVHVLTRMQPGLASFERMGGVRVHRVGVARARGAAGSAAFIAAAVPAAAWLARRLDVLHAHQLLSPATVGLLASALAGVPLVVNPHACGAIGDVGVLSASRTGRLRLQAIVRNADAFVAVSRTIRAELIEAGAPPDAIWSIGNGVDTDRFSPALDEERRRLRRVLGLPGCPLVVYTGRLSREKGVDVLVDAWPRLLERVPSARLCLVGAGAEEGRLAEQARARGVEGAIIFAGAVTDVAPHLRAADAAVLPSRTEGMPLALLEAMSCALPVVATRVGGSAEVLDDGVIGRLVPPDRPDALAAGLAEALLEHVPSGHRGAAARARVLAEHGLDRIAGRFLELYQAVTARRGSVGALAAVPSPTERWR